MSAPEVPQGQKFLLGPSSRLELLAAFLDALGARARRVDDLEDLRDAHDPDETLVLDVEAIPDTDLGYVERHADRRAGWNLVLVGSDAGTRVARALCARPGVRWLAWPPDLDELALLAGFGAQSGTEASTPASRAPLAPVAAEKRLASAPARGAPRVDEDPREADEMDAIDAILAGAELPAPRAPRESGPSPTADAALPRPDVAPEVTLGAPAIETPTDPPTDPHTDPPTGLAAADERDRERRRCRAQVADLADLAQRIELAAEALRAADPDDGAEWGARSDALDVEVRRVVMFAHTLGILIAPPARGTQTFDLAEFTNLSVVSLGNSGPDAPRCQYRSQGAVHVRSDRALLGAAFDAIFYLVRATSQRGDLVRAEVRRLVATVEVRIEFPAGPLTDVEPAEIVEPYALRARLPELGANALAAAAAIVRGQGGQLALARIPRGRLEWRLELPPADE